jgi:hypothetical protein
MSLRYLIQITDRFFFEERNLEILGWVRILVSVFLLINLVNLAPNVLEFFGPHGPITPDAARAVIDPDVISLFYFLPASDATVVALFTLLIAQVIMLGVGIFTRFQALCVFILLTSFHHRNILIFDGEDVVFRLFVFFLILSPAGHYLSLDRLRKRSHKDNIAPQFPVWPLRLFQIEMTFIYASTAIEKMGGQEWLDGTALYYIYRLEEFERFPLPAAFFNEPIFFKTLTWMTVGTEAMIPIFLWFRELRLIGLVLGFGLHLSIEYQMNLNMFQWIMMTGLCTFLPGTTMYTRSKQLPSKM